MNSEWDTLALAVHATCCRLVSEGFWPRVVSLLAKSRDIDVMGPSQEAWFHVRRTTPRSDIVEALRLRQEGVSAKDREAVRLLGEEVTAVRCADWCPETFQPQHDNAFLSFLQKLSVLRARDGVCYPEFLASTPIYPYEKDPTCQKAYRVMTCQSAPWYSALSPWFEYMERIHMDNRMTHEYAHWFGHIMSGWPIT